MSKSNVKVAPALHPRSVFSMESPAVFYKLHEASGTVIEDALGYGPDLAVFGTGTVFGTQGWATPNGTDHYATVSSANFGNLANLLKLSDTFGQILVGFDITVTDATPAAIEYLFYAGHNDSATGGWGLYVSTTGQIAMGYRGTLATAKTDDAFSNFVLSDIGTSTRITILVDFKKVSSGMLDANVYANGIFKTANPNIDLTLNGGTPYSGPISASNQAFTMLARADSSTTRSAYANIGVSGMQFGRLFIAKFSDWSSTRALETAQELYAYQGEFPRNLNGL